MSREKRDYVRGWELLCDQMPNEEALTAMEKMRGFYRTRTIRSGGLLEVEVYPVIPRRQIKEALKKKGETREAQKRQNQRNAERRCMRLIEANFGEGDWYLTATIEGDRLPTLEEVQKMAQGFVRRVNYRRKQEVLENARYIYVIEGYEEGSRQQRLHLHFIMDGGLSREVLKTLWGKGRCKCDELAPEEYGGLIKLAKYMLKDPRGRKRWRASKNLKQPVITTADRKVSSRAVQRIAENTAGRAAALEKLYEGYEHQETDVRTNPFIAGCYIYAVLRKKQDGKKKQGGKKDEQGHSGRTGRNGPGIRADKGRRKQGGVPAGGAEEVQKRAGKV